MTQQTYKRPQRGRGKHNSDFSQRDIYNFYRKNRRHDCQLVREDFYRIIKAFNNKIMKQVIYNNNPFCMPYSLGTIRVEKFQPKDIVFDDKGNIIKNDLVVDFSRTNKLWENNPEAYEKRKKIYLLNEHTNGYIYRFHWRRKGARTKNIHLYKFVPVRKWKQMLKELLFNTDRKVDFYEQKR